ncbi:MAG: hypothetical protein NTZ32_17230 [Planctomycetales bacterium]|nr:hypothetical protein [Planctomycetales bacterium]
MQRSWIQTLASWVVISVVITSVRPVSAQEPATEKTTVAFDQVRPVFQKHCTTCHNSERPRGDLDLTSVEALKSGSASGSVVVSGKPSESLLYTLAAHLETPKMPPGKSKIPQRELDLIKGWIEGGLTVRGEVSDKSKASAAMKPATVNVPKEEPKAIRAATKMTGSVAIEPVPRATAITALAVSPKAPLVAISGRKQVVLFQWTDLAPLKAFPFPEGDVFALRFSRDGKVLVAGGGVGGESGKVVGFDVATGRRLFELGDEADVVLALDISADRSLVALGGPGRSVKVFRTADGELIATLRKHTDWILSLAFSPEGLLLASGDRFGALQVWEAKSGKEFHTLRGHVGPVNAVSWSTDSERLLSAGQDGSLRFWDMHEGKQIEKWNGDVGGILTVECDAFGKVVCGGRDRKLTVWEKPETKLQQMQMPDEVVKLAFSHESSHVIATDAAGNVSVFTLGNGSLAGRFVLPVAAALAKTPTTPPARSKPALRTSPSLPADSSHSPEVISAEADARKAAAELVEVREAAALADAAVKSTEESLKKLRESAGKLQSVVSQRDEAAKQAAQRAAELRTKTESTRPKSTER